MINRRVFIKTGVSAAALPLLQFSSSNEVQRFAIFLPGIMGSTLASGNGPGAVNLWTADITYNYDRLVNYPNTLKFSGRPAVPTGILAAAELWPKSVDFHVARYYTGVITLLKSHPAFQRNGALQMWAYDWRRSLLDLTNEMQSRLSAEVGIKYAENGQANELENVQIDLIGHSMGGVLSLLLTAKGLLHPKNIRSLILIGPPFFGSANAFRSLFDDSITLPFVEDLIGLTWFRSRRIALDILHDVFSSFDSIYQLIPPESSLFVEDAKTEKLTHPFNFLTVSPDSIHRAKEAHKEIADAIRNPILEKAKIHLLLGIGQRTDSRYKIRQAPSSIPRHIRCTLVPPVTTGNGDGTVLYDSSTFDDDFLSRCTTYLHAAVKHSQLCEDPAPVETIRTILA